MESSGQSQTHPNLDKGLPVMDHFATLQCRETQLAHSFPFLAGGLYHAWLGCILPIKPFIGAQSQMASRLSDPSLRSGPALYLLVVSGYLIGGLDHTAL